jgi:pyruvate dehydrogenase E2 component (dihydrolipoamide acetyltransferase)
MPVEVIMPKVDMDMATGKISRWLVAEGASVKQGEPLFEIETDKAAMEVEAPASGTLGDVTGKQGAEVAVGSPVAWIYAEGEARNGAAKARPNAAEAVAPAVPIAASAGVAPAARSESVPVNRRATPLARRLAREQNIEIARLSGSGPKGRVQAQDIAATASRGETTPSTAVASPGVRRDAMSSNGASWLRQGGGTPIVLLHGFGSETASWRPFLAAFEHDGAILSLDLPGHGGAIDAVAECFDGLVAHVEAQLGAQGLTAAHLAGHSLGGAIAAAVAAGSAIEARSLFLIAPAGFGTEINMQFTAGFAAARTEDDVRKWMRGLVADPNVFSESFLKAAARSRADGRLAQAQTRLAAKLFEEGTQAFAVRAALDRLTIPVKIVAGTRDDVIPYTQFAGLPGAIALHLFDGIGHMPHLEDRVSVARLLRELIRAAGS